MHESIITPCCSHQKIRRDMIFDGRIKQLLQCGSDVMYSCSSGTKAIPRRKLQIHCVSNVKFSTVGATHIAEAVLQVCTFTGLGTCSASTSQCSTVTSRCGSRPSDMFKLHSALCKYSVQALLYHDPDTLSESLRLHAKCRWTTDTWSSFR